MDEMSIANDVSTGLGFIMLLSGEPGVGKTLTAESGALIQRNNSFNGALLKGSQSPRRCVSRCI